MTSSVTPCFICPKLYKGSRRRAFITGLIEFDLKIVNVCLFHDPYGVKRMGDMLCDTFYATGLLKKRDHIGMRKMNIKKNNIQTIGGKNYNQKMADL